MAPIKFENNIKEKLEERRLTPSDKTWEILQGKLDANASKRNRKPFWWIGLAASFVGVLLVSTLFFNKEDDVMAPIEIVDIEAPDSIKINTIEFDKAAQKKTLLSNVTNEEKDVDSNISVLSNKNLVKQSNLKQNNQVLKELKNKNVSVAQKEVDEELKTETNEELSIEQLQINAMITEIAKLDKSANTLAIDSEVDALLQEAQREIAFDKLYNQAIKTVDANLLLQNVEEEVKESFRNKVFKAFVNGYKDLSTAFVNRNN